MKGVRGPRIPGRRIEESKKIKDVRNATLDEFFGFDTEEALSHIVGTREGCECPCHHGGLCGKMACCIKPYDQDP